jgi:hypothetical protein
MTPVPFTSLDDPWPTSPPIVLPDYKSPPVTYTKSQPGWSSRGPGNSDRETEDQRKREFEQMKREEDANEFREALKRLFEEV